MQLPKPRVTRWLVVVHIEIPQHWTLIQINWQHRTVEFFDSFSRVGGYADEVKWLSGFFLQIALKHMGKVFSAQDWTWVPEQV